MPFPSSLSAPNQTTKRGGCFAERYLIVHTPSIQLQFHPSIAASANVNAVIPYNTALSGSYTNVLLGMTVIISPTSDYTADLRNQPENCFVTYIRSAAGANSLAIGATKYQFATSDYVTVLNDYRIFERKLRAISANDIRRDWDIAFRKPKPRIYGLYSTVLSTSGSTASISLTPSAEVMAASGSISTWAWNVADGTITTGSSSSQNITVSFPLGTRYVHLTVTDSNGISNYLTALIAVIPSTLSSIIHLNNTQFSLKKSLNDGNSADFIAYANATWLDGSQAMIATYAKYQDGTTALTSSMIGWLKDIRDTIAPDNDKGLLLELSANLQGINYFAGQLHSEGFFTELRSTPSIWGQFNRLTPYDCLWYLVSEHSTLANVAAFEFPANHADFKFPEINIPSGTILDVMNILSFRCIGGIVNYSPNGEVVFEKSLLYETSDSERNAADVYATYEFADSLSIDFSRVNNLGILAVGQILMGCAAYNTTTKLPRVYISKAPAGDESGYLREELDSIILPANDTDSNNRSLAGTFTANHFFAINESPELRLSLIDGYHTIEPSAFQWHKFLLEDSTSGALLSSSERFLCTELSIDYDDEHATVAVQASFRKETNGGSNYLQETIYVNTNQPNVQPFIPQTVPSPFLDTGLDNEDTYDSSSNDNSGLDGSQDPTLPPQQQGEAMEQGPKVQESVSVPFFNNNAIYSINPLANGAPYLLRITGDATVGSSGGTIIFNFRTQGQQMGWTPNVFMGQDRATWVGNKWESIIQGNTGLGAVVIEKPYTWPADFFISQIRYYVENGAAGAPFNGVFGMPYVNPFAGASVTISPDGFLVGDGWDKDTRTGMGIEHSAWADTGSIRSIYRVDFDYTGTLPSGIDGELVLAGTWRGDAWYMKYDISDTQQYPSGKGLYINGSLPTIPAFSPGHVYEIPFTGTGSTIPFQYFDPENNYANNSNSYFRVDIIPL